MHIHTHSRTHRTCRPPPRRKLPFAVNLIRGRVPCLHNPSLTNTRVHNGCPVAFSTAATIAIYIYTRTTSYLRAVRTKKKKQQKGVGGGRTTFLCTWSFARRLHFRRRELQLFKRHFPPLRYTRPKLALTSRNPRQIASHAIPSPYPISDFRRFDA